MLIEIYCNKFGNCEKYGTLPPVIKFHEGLNAVVDDRNRLNSVDKSTFLMIIDFAFGGDDYIKKCAAVHESAGAHDICFTFEFEGREYSFRRNNIRHQEVIRCDRQYYPMRERKPIKIDGFREFLAEKYRMNMEGLTWRGVMSKHIRICGRDTMDTTRPLRSSKNSKAVDDIKRYLKQFGKYDVIEKQIEQAEVAKGEMEFFRKSAELDYIKMAKNNTEYKKNEIRAKELEKQETELVENSSKGLLDLSGMQAQQISDLNELLIGYTRQKARIQTQLNAIRREMVEGKKSFKRTYEDLERFFPGMEFKEISEIENFHQKLAKILKAEFMESEQDLSTTYTMLESEITKIKEKIAEIKNIPNVSQAVLKAYADITTELNNLRSEHDNYRTFNELKKRAKEYAVARDEVIAEQLSEIQHCINNEMEYISMQIVRGEQVIPPRLNLKKLDAYSFETNGDGGSGTDYRGLITFDLANMRVLGIPFLIHDAASMDSIEGSTLTELINMYCATKSFNKQVFCSFRSCELYSEEARLLRKDCNVIQL